MHFSSCPGSLCLKIECNHVKKVMWDIEEKEPDVTFSDFHLWVVLSEPREHSNLIKAVSISFHHLTADRRTGGSQFTSLYGLPWFGFFFKVNFNFQNSIKFTLWGSPGFHEITTKTVDGRTSTPAGPLSMKARIWKSKGKDREGKCGFSPLHWDYRPLSITLLMETSVTVSLFLMLKPIWPFLVWNPPHKAKDCVIQYHFTEERWRFRQVK